MKFQTSVWMWFYKKEKIELINFDIFKLEYFKDF